VNRLTCRIFEEVSGFHYCCASLDYLDARGMGYPSRSSALRVAFSSGFTHAIHKGKARAISSLVSLSPLERKDHARALMHRFLAVLEGGSL
jgi:hypothetical protein